MTLFKSLAAAAVVSFSAAAAFATPIDFTDPSAFTVDDATTISGTTSEGVDWTLTAIGGDFNLSEAGPGNAITAPLLGQIDGVGITDDEVSFPLESLRLSFSSAVELSTIYFLDLFAPEIVHISNGVDSIVVGSTVVFDENVDNFGFVAESSTLVGTVFTFIGDAPNDPTANPDFALAGLQVATVPLPAGILLLGGALAGLGIARRRAS